MITIALLSYIHFYIANTIFITLITIMRKDIIKGAKGGNGILQPSETLQLACVFLFIEYALIIMFLGITAEGSLLAAIMTGAGIGTIGTAFRKNKKEEKHED